MLYAQIGDIVEAKTEVIVNASNGIGILGANAAGAIRKAGGYEIEEEAQGICQKNQKPIEPGQCFITGPGKLRENGVKYIYHAVTMKYPGEYSSLKDVSDAWREVFRKAIQNKIKSISTTGLGTGIGRLDVDSVARDMVRIAKQYAFINDIDVYFIDRDQEFIDRVKENIEKVG